MLFGELVDYINDDLEAYHAYMFRITVSTECGLVGVTLRQALLPSHTPFLEAIFQVFTLQRKLLGEQGEN